MGCRWRWSWPRRAPGSWSRRRCWRGWSTAWPCCAGTPLTCRPATARCAPRSTGATPCSARQEQAVFRRLGVFAGGFTLEAVEAVAATDELDVEPLDVVQGLVDKHLVRVLESAAGDEPRFGLLATVREYALERLAESGESEATRDRHLAYYLALAEQAERAMLGPDETRWLNRLDREIDNLRLAHDWAIARGDAEAEWRLVAALALFWVLARLSAGGRASGSMRRGRAHIEADPALRARFLEGAGLLALWSGDDDRAVAHFEGSLAAAQAAGDRALAAHVLGQLGTVVYAQGDVARARALIAEMLTLARAADSGLDIGYAYVWRVLIAIGPHGSPREREQLRGELDEPVARLREAGLHRDLADAAGRPRPLAHRRRCPGRVRRAARGAGAGARRG